MGGLRAPPGWARYGGCSALSSCVLSLLPRERRVDLIPQPLPPSFRAARHDLPPRCPDSWAVRRVPGVCEA